MKYLVHHYHSRPSLLLRVSGHLIIVLQEMKDETKNYHWIPLMKYLVHHCHSRPSVLRSLPILLVLVNRTARDKRLRRSDNHDFISNNYLVNHFLSRPSSPFFVHSIVVFLKTHWLRKRGLSTFVFLMKPADLTYLVADQRPRPRNLDASQHPTCYKERWM